MKGNMNILQKSFIPNEKHHNLYDPLFEYMDFYVNDTETYIEKYGKNYKVTIMEIAKVYGYNLFIMYLTNGIRMAKLKLPVDWCEKQGINGSIENIK